MAGSTRFMYIDPEGKVYESKPFDILFEDDLKMVFNWTIQMMNCAAKSSPHTSPTKPGVEQDQELADFKNEVFYDCTSRKAKMIIMTVILMEIDEL